MREAMNQFRDAIARAGLTPPDAIEADGKLHRFASGGKRGDDSGRYVLHSDGIAAGWIGDYRTGLSQTWRADVGRKLTQAEEAAHRAKVEAMRRQREAEEKARHAEAAAKAAALVKAGTREPAGNPYLTRKGVSAVATLWEIDAGAAAAILGYSPKSGGEVLTGRLLVAPVKIGDRFTTCELIDEAGRKSAIYGGAKAGGYWAAQPLPQGYGAGLTLLIGEGVATLLSGREATGHLAIAALSSGNLPAVAKSMRERYPAAALVILADLVKATGAPDQHAIEAARAVGALLAIPDFGNDRPEGATDYNDMAQHRGKEAVKQAVAKAIAPARAEHQPDAGDAPAGDPRSWPEPLPLVAKVEPESYPLDALPVAIRAAVEEVQAFVQAPVAMVASSALGALSLAIQSHADVQRAEKLSGPVGLFVLTIADSGERKSTCDGYFTTAIKDYQEQQAEAAKPDIKNYEAAKGAWESRKGGLKERIKADTKAGKPTSEFERKLRDLEDEKPEAPRVPKLLRGDDTPENLAFVLSREWPSAGVLSSEAGLVLGAHGMGKDSIMRNLGLLNILWDGGTLAIGRRTSESFTVKGARLTVALQVQEATLRSFFDRSDGLARGTGFLARFLVAWPESTQGFRPFTEAPASWPHLAAFNRRISAILNQPAPINEDGSLTPAMLTLTPDAKAAWVEFNNAIEAELASGGELYDVRDVASKSADNAARLAALFQTIEGAGGAIGAEAFESASRIAAWHLNESRRFFGELALPAELADAGRLDSWLIEYCRRERTHLVPKNRARQHGPVRDGKRLDEAIRELEGLDRARLVQDGKRRIIKVNPALVIEGEAL